MALARLLAHRGNVLRLDGSGTADEYGNVQETWQTESINNPFRFQLHNAWEEREGRWMSVQSWRGYTVAATDVLKSDRLYWVDEGRTFEVLAVEPVANRVGTHHKYCMLQEVT